MQISMLFFAFLAATSVSALPNPEAQHPASMPTLESCNTCWWQCEHKKRGAKARAGTPLGVSLSRHLFRFPKSFTSGWRLTNGLTCVCHSGLERSLARRPATAIPRAVLTCTLQLSCCYSTRSSSDSSSGSSESRPETRQLNETAGRAAISCWHLPSTLEKGREAEKSGR